MLGNFIVPEPKELWSCADLASILISVNDGHASVVGGGAFFTYAEDEQRAVVVRRGGAAEFVGSEQNRTGNILDGFGGRHIGENCGEALTAELVVLRIFGFDGPVGRED